MIRVTYRESDGSYYENEEHDFLITNIEDRIKLLQKGNYQDFFTIVLKENLIKIEKQVKDLTVEELTKLNAMVIKSKTSSVAFDETKVAGQGLLSSRNGRTKTSYFVDYDDKFYELDEYVDITSIIKGE